MSKTVQGRSGAHSKASKRRKKQKNRLIIVVIEILVLLILAAVLFVTVKLSKIQKDTSFNKEDIEVNEGLSSESQEIMAGYTTIALFGLDNRSNGNLSKGNSDVIMIASINNDTHAVKLVSVYRDSYLDIGGGTFKKCNSAYAKGGPEQAITMLNKNLDMDITDYVTVDFNAVVECVDLLGGVTIPEVSDEEAVLMHGYMDEINKLTKNNSKYLSGGGTNVEMDGVQACAYARIRYTTGDDYKRTERQRTVLTAMVQKAQKANLTTINSLLHHIRIISSINTRHISHEIRPPCYRCNSGDYQNHNNNKRPDFAQRIQYSIQSKNNRTDNKYRKPNGSSSFRQSPLLGKR